MNSFSLSFVKWNFTLSHFVKLCFFPFVLLFVVSSLYFERKSHKDQRIYGLTLPIRVCDSFLLHSNTVDSLLIEWVLHLIWIHCFWFGTVRCISCIWFYSPLKRLFRKNAHDIWSLRISISLFSLYSNLHLFFECENIIKIKVEI